MIRIKTKHGEFMADESYALGKEVAFSSALRKICGEFAHLIPAGKGEAMQTASGRYFDIFPEGRNCFLLLED